MGYLNQNGTITVDAILTKFGRAALAKGDGSFNITQFAVADDECDYSLWNPSNPAGSQFYNSAIINMPLLEASTDETKSMKWKLFSAPNGTATVSLLTIGVSAIVLTSGQSGFPVSPSTSNGFNGSGFGYVAVLADSSAAIITGTGLATGTNAATIPSFSDSQNSSTVSGLNFIITPKSVLSQVVTSITFYGAETGNSLTVSLTVNPAPTN